MVCCVITYIYEGGNFFCYGEVCASTLVSFTINIGKDLIAKKVLILLMFMGSLHRLLLFKACQGQIRCGLVFSMSGNIGTCIVAQTVSFLVLDFGAPIKKSIHNCITNDKHRIFTCGSSCYIDI